MLYVQICVSGFVNLELRISICGVYGTIYFKSKPYSTSWAKEVFLFSESKKFVSPKDI